MPRGPSTVIAALLATSLLAAASPSLEAQLRRSPAIQPVAEVRAGELLLGVGGGWADDESFPLSGLAGDVLTPAALTLAFGLADRVVLELRWDAWRMLEIERRGPSGVPLDPGVEDGRTADVGDARLGVLFAPVGRRQGPALGGRVEVKLPNTSEEKGIGPNTTDVRLSVLGSLGLRRWRATADLGVAILESPLERFAQNDVAVYAAELLYRPTGRLRLALGVDGRASTRGRVPLGTEDRGIVTLGAEVTAGGWLVDVAAAAGYAGTSPAWALEAGLARRAGGRRTARPRVGASRGRGREPRRPRARSGRQTRRYMEDDGP